MRVAFACSKDLNLFKNVYSDLRCAFQSADILHHRANRTCILIMIDLHLPLVVHLIGLAILIITGQILGVLNVRITIVHPLQSTLVLRTYEILRPKTGIVQSHIRHRLHGRTVETRDLQCTTICGLGSIVTRWRNGCSSHRKIGSSLMAKLPTCMYLSNQELHFLTKKQLRGRNTFP